MLLHEPNTALVLVTMAEDFPWEGQAKYYNKILYKKKY